MTRYEIQLLSRREGDYERHREVALALRNTGKVAFRSYHFAGRKSLVVLLERLDDVEAALRRLPEKSVVSVRDIAGDPCLPVMPDFGTRRLDLDPPVSPGS